MALAPTIKIRFARDATGRLIPRKDAPLFNKSKTVDPQHMNPGQMAIIPKRKIA